MRKVACATGLGVALLIGCATTTRDRLMHFFFEIPDTQEGTASAVDQESPGAPAAQEAPQPAIFEPPPERYASIHRPVIERNCHKCHDAGNRMQVDEDLLMSSCSQCHQRFFSDEVGHGPVAAGECRSCHTLHRSKEPALLLLPVFDTCIECHDEPEDLSEDSHASDDVENCIRCHDPHFGEGFFLRPGVEVPAG